ncbi:MAG TPA: deoxyribose-phosphate aldolase [Bryobacteraceae bacterium]|nr:deoxyribose-phosphate aldolase [Bryobacteraceae bacterium]
MSLNLNLEDPSAVASLIDHTLLKPDAREADVTQLCEEALRWNFASVCVNPYWVPLCASVLAGSPVNICTVIGFPLGANAPVIKLAEAEHALQSGAQELDLVQNIGALRSGQLASVDKEIEDLARRVHHAGSLLKVILETSLLTDEEIVLSCRLAVRAGADFVKTSTGFSGGGATKAHVALLRQAVGLAIGVKASGGIRTLAVLREMVSAGANRIGSSSGIAILNELAAAGTGAAAPEGGY